MNKPGCGVLNRPLDTLQRSRSRKRVERPLGPAFHSSGPAYGSDSPLQCAGQLSRTEIPGLPCPVAIPADSAEPAPLLPAWAGWQVSLPALGTRVPLAQQMHMLEPGSLPAPHPCPRGPQRCWAGSCRAACAVPVSEVTAQSGVRRVTSRPPRDAAPHSPVPPEPLSAQAERWHGDAGGAVTTAASQGKRKKFWGKRYEKGRYTPSGATISRERDLSALAQHSHSPSAARRGTTAYFTLAQQAVPDEARRPCAPPFRPAGSPRDPSGSRCVPTHPCPAHGSPGTARPGPVNGEIQRSHPGGGCGVSPATHRVPAGSRRAGVPGVTASRRGAAPPPSSAPSCRLPQRSARRGGRKRAGPGGGGKRRRKKKKK